MSQALTFPVINQTIARSALLIMTFLCVYFLSGMGNLNADDKVIYGEDNRSLISNASDPRYKDWAAATAILIQKRETRPAFGGFLTAINSSSLKDSGHDVCADDPYADQPLGGFCTGFLVAPDVMVTAGHCVFSNWDCQNSAWIFDFRSDLVVDGEDLFVDSESVIGCKEVIRQEFDHQLEIDYAVVRLERAVTDRRPLKFRRSGKLADDNELALIGHPLGLPSIVTDNGKIRDNSLQDHFLSNLDSFKGNSGAPVINAVSGEVEGLLISGEDDFVFDEVNQCFRSNVCADSIDDNCDGEKALRITHLEDVLSQVAPASN